MRAAGAVVALCLLLAGCTTATAADPVPSPGVDLSTWDPEADNGLALVPGTTARAAILDAMRTAGPVVMTGTLTDAAGVTTHVRVAGDRATYDALIDVGGAQTRIQFVSGDTFVQPSATIAAEYGLPADTATCVPADAPVLDRWAELLHPASFVARLTADASGVGAPHDGVVDLVLGTEATEGALVVAATGAPLPQSLVRADPAGSVILEFADWGVPVDVAAPGEGC